MISGKERYETASPRQRLAIDALVGGATLLDAHHGAGYKGGQQAASGWLKRWQPAVDYQRDLLSKDSADRREQALARAELVAKANIADLFPDGLELSDDDWRALSREAKFLVESIQVDRLKETVKLKLKPWAAAQTFLARVEGWETIKIQDVTEPEVLEARAKLEEQVNRRRAAKGDE